MEPVVFVPGLACTERLFAPQIAALSGRTHIFLANHRRHASIAEIARSILCEAPARFSLVGLSMGGFIALEIMRQAGGRVSRLVLMDTNARADAPERTEARKAHVAMAESGRFEAVVRELFESYLPDARRADAALFGIVRDMAMSTGPDVFVAQTKAIIGRRDSRPGLADIMVPTLVVVGEGDRLSPPDLSRQITDGIAGARLEVLRDCGHLATLERPNDVNQLLVDFLN